MTRFLSLAVGCFVLTSAGSALAKETSKETRGTPAQAEALVKKAVALINTKGQAKAFEEINNQKGHFVDRDLYISVFDMNGNCLANGYNAKLVGKNLLDLKDPDGRAMVKERVDLAKTQDKFWQRDYLFVDPLTKTVKHKDMYVEKTAGGILVCCGIFRD